MRLALSEHAPAVPGVPVALVPRITRDYFAPAFEAGVAADAATAGGACAADPGCVGLFTDNEVALGQSLAQPLPYMDAYLLLPPGAPAIARSRLSSRRATPATRAFAAAWGDAR